MDDDMEQTTSPEGGNQTDIDYWELFRTFDRDNSESVDVNELGEALRYIGCNPTNDEVAAMIAEAEGKVNADGRLSFDEFRELIANNRKSLDQEVRELNDAFRVFDKNCDGTIDRSELKQILTDVGLGGEDETELDDLFQTADYDGNGRIDYRELVFVITGRRPD